MNSAGGIVPTSSNSIHAPEPDYMNTTTTTTTTTYNTTPAAPPNPADLVQIPLRLTSTKKKSSIAKFHTPHNARLDFSTMAHPVKMFRAPEVSEPEPAPPPKENPFFKKKSSQYNERKPVIKDAKAVSLVIHKTPINTTVTHHHCTTQHVPFSMEDSEGNHAYEGVLEGGQTSNYALLVFENGVFNVIPVGDWYNFKPKRTYQTFSTEEAESMMSKRSELAKKLAEKHGQLQAIVKAEEGAAAAAVKPDKEDAEFNTTEEEDPDRFAAFGRADSDEEKKKKKEQKQKSVKKEEGGDSDNGEEPDWEGVFDDDEDPGGQDEEVEAAPGRDAGEAEGEGEEKDDLTEAGKELRSLLKKQKDDDLSEASDFGSEEEDEDDDDEDDFNLEEKLPFINHLKFNPSAETKQEDGSKDSDEARPSPQQSQDGGDKEKKKSPTGSKKKGRSKNKDAKEETSPKGEKPKKSSKKAGGSNKRGAEGADIKSPTNSKKIKVEAPKSEKPDSSSKPTASSAKPAAVVGGPAVTEEEVRRVLSQGKRLRTFDLVGHFKAALVDQKQKQKFTELTRRLCSIVEEGGVKYLMLK